MKTKLMDCKTFRRGYWDLAGRMRDSGTVYGSIDTLFPEARSFGKHRRKCKSCDRWAAKREKAF